MLRFVLPCDNRTKATFLHFTNVTNCSDLKKDARTGNISACLLRSSLIFGEFQVLVATNMAVNAKNTNSMKTRNLFTEIMYYMSCTRNISDALNRFSVQENDTSFVAVLIDDDEQNSAANQLTERVKGRLTPLDSNLAELSDIKAIRKIYKIKSDENSADLLSAIVSRISTKEIVSF